MIKYREQVASALRAVAVTSPTSFAWFGTRSRPLSRAVLAGLNPGTARRYLVDGLQRELYRSFYCQGRPIPAQPGRGAAPRSDYAFVQALSDANTGSGGWEPGWRVERVDQGIARVQRAGLSVRAPISDCRGALEAGAPVSVRRPKELTAAAPGFYIALGDAESAGSRGDVEVRVYFNVSPAGTAPLVGACTRRLNDARIPFILKVLDHPAGFTRCDPAILYLEAGGFDRAREALSAIASACSPRLRRELPTFTKPLASGVSVGEHRLGLGGSFGSSRCRLVAEGIVAAHERGAADLSDRIDAVARRFEDHGLDFDAPYLAQRSRRRYEL